MALTKVRGSGIDADGQELILDADADTSITADTDDQIDIKIGGSDKITINSSGRVGVGTTDIDAPLDIVDGTEYIRIAQATTDDTTKTGGFAVRHRDNEEEDFNVINGVSGSSSNIVNIGGSDFIGSLNAATAISFFTAANRTTVDGTQRMTIDSSGNALVGTSSTTPNPGIALQPNGNIGIGNSSGNSGVSFLEFRRSATQIGGVTQSGTTGVAFNTSSDYRLKENVNYDFDATSRLKQLKPSRFNFKTDKDVTVDGFLAHEVSSIVPEAITGKKDAVDADGNPEYQGIDQSKLVPLLTKSLQEALARIDTLEAEVAKLKG